MDIQDSVLPTREWPEKNSPLKSPWVLGWLAMVAVIISANIVMMTFAYKTSPGLVVEDYYEKGKNYNKSLEKIAAENALGWEAELIIPEGVVAGEATRYSLTVFNQEGMPVAADKVEFFAFRPSDVNSDFSTAMKAETGGGYVATINFPLPGIWDVVVSIVRDNDQFEVTKRIFAGKKTAS